METKKRLRSWIFLSALVILCAILLALGGNVYVDRLNTGREMEALQDAHMLGRAALEYAQDHRERYPDGGKWEQELMPYLGADAARMLHPPAPLQGTPRRFSLNPALAGKTSAQFPEKSTPWLFYESVASTSSATDDLAYWPNPSKDGGFSSAVVYDDGHFYSRPFAWKQAVREHLPGL